MLTSANDAQDRDPRDWVLKGSHDGRDWTVLDTRAGESFPSAASPRLHPHHRCRGRHRLPALPPGHHAQRRIAPRPARPGPVLHLAPVPAAFSGWYHRADAGVVGYRGTGTPTAGLGSEPSGPRTAEQWRRYLKEYSAEVLRASGEDELHHVSDEQRAAGWLGFEGADEERIRALEERLGKRLPPSLRGFLAASDGWSNLSSFMWEMRTTATIGWVRDVDPDLWSIIRGDELPVPLDVGDAEDARFADDALLISMEADAQYWLLDSSDVSEDGEWAAYIWASWYPGFGDRCASFADLVAEERESFEMLSGREGRACTRTGPRTWWPRAARRAARRGQDGAGDLREGHRQGSGAGAYLRTVLGGFLDMRFAHHEVRNNILAHPHVVDAVGREQVRAEAAALYLRGEAETGRLGASRLPLLDGLMPELDAEADEDDGQVAARNAAFAAPPLPEPAAFQEALDVARSLILGGATDDAWDVVEAALPQWRSDAPYRIAPVVLLADPVLRRMMTPPGPARSSPRPGWTAWRNGSGRAVGAGGPGGPGLGRPRAGAGGSR
ncbi:SMI1/KNR4 family protein [Streptomyces sp. M19]